MSFAELTAGGCAKSTGKKSPAPGRTGPSWLGLRPGRRAGAGARRAAARAGKVDRGLLPDDTYCADQPAGEAGHQPAAAARWHQARSKKGSATFQGLVALLAANNMQLEQIKLVDIGFGVQPLLVKQVDAIMGFSMNEPIESESGGMAVSLMPISDYGVNTYGLTIVSNPGFMQQKPRGGSGLRRCLHLPITGHRHPRQANCPRLALAERLRRKTDRIDSSRVR